jgi:hypothetical protein
MLIRVTQADIEQGRRTDCYLCPIALAINRALNLNTGSQGIQGAQVYRSQITPKIFHVVQPTSRRVERFIWAFDHNLPVSPFNFRLRVEKRFK